MEEMGGEVFISPPKSACSFINKMIEVLFPICTLIWRVNNYVFRQADV